ncbi:hypothetical protein WR25_01396 [Diploscapter pachys]|uniref:Autophagy-related protein 2 n=1 Tax=Diploscapter pachys TaxID=2018661 RepID=A0A2A2LXB0_9BILA|nr:hypothetical protein WR25_01396 [Diploscapter pachys]
MFDKDACFMSTTLFSIADIIVKDQLILSQIKEMLYQYSNNSQPRRTLAPMLAVRIAETPSSAGKMRISILPIKINIDQDTMNFLIDFGLELQNKTTASEEVSNALANRPQVEVPVNCQTPTASLKKPQPTLQVDKLYPELSMGAGSLNMEPLTPSPVAPPSPLGDLSYLENRANKTSPRLRNPLPDAPLTASAVSIGGLFANSRCSPRRPSPAPALSELSELADLPSAQRDSQNPSSSDSNSSSPEFEKTTEKISENDGEDLAKEEMCGDWNSTTEYENILGELENDDFPSTSEASKPATQQDIDNLLSRSTMGSSIHPGMVGCLVDTRSDSEGDDEVETIPPQGEQLDVTFDEGGTHSARSSFEGTQIEENQFQQSGKSVSEDEAAHLGRRHVFFKEFVFSPATSIFIDYHGKNKISMDRGGPLIGLLMGLGQLSQTELVLKEIVCQNGLLGVEKCIAYALDEWSRDAYSNVPQVLASIGPINPLVQIGKGFMDLFWMPVVEFRKEDGHPVKGLQKGFSSFGLNSAAGIVGMAQTLVGLVQSVTEAALYEVQPQDSYLNARNRRAIAPRIAPPTDLRHGLQLGYGLVTDGIRQTQTDFELAAQEDRASGRSATRSVFRYAVPAILRPLVLSTQVTHQLLGGLRNQLRPDIYEDERHKWRENEVPGGSGQ